MFRFTIRDVQLIQFARYPAACPKGILNYMDDQLADDSFDLRPTSIDAGLHAAGASHEATKVPREFEESPGPCGRDVKIGRDLGL